MIKPLAMLALVGACQSVPYRYYGMDVDRLEQAELGVVTLLAGGDYGDLNGLDCWHAPGSAPRCTCSEESEFVQMRTDYKETRKRLEDCEGFVLDEDELFTYRFYGLELSALSVEVAKQIELVSADPKEYSDLDGRDCLNAPGTSPRCVCMTDSDQLALVSDIRSMQARLDRCEKEEEGL